MMRGKQARPLQLPEGYLERWTRQAVREALDASEAHATHKKRSGYLMRMAAQWQMQLDGGKLDFCL